MEVIGMILFFVGAIVAFIGGIWFLIAAFQESVLWGLGLYFSWSRVTYLLDPALGRGRQALSCPVGGSRSNVCRDDDDGAERLTP